MAFHPRSLYSQAVHSGEERRYSTDPLSNNREEVGQATPVAGPIQPSVSYVYAETADLDAALGGDPDRYVYHRYGNPTVKAFERAIARLEALDWPEDRELPVAFATSSGMSAMQLALMAAGAQSGVTLAAAQDCYGATYALIDKLWPSLGAKGLFVDATDLSAVEQMLDAERPHLMVVETISNPLLKVMDIAELAQLCHTYNTLLLVDNTFATPFLYRPLTVGADFVVHSATKYIGGHGDVMGGVVIAGPTHQARLWEFLKTTGANLGPQEAWLLTRGLKTLPLRMERQCRNAALVAEWLDQHPAVERVIFPGNRAHPQHRLALESFGGDHFGAVVSFEVAGGTQEKIFTLFESLQMIQPATSVGDVYTLIVYPAHSSHRALTSAQRAAIGIGEGLVRLSVGIEAVEDIVADLEQAFSAAGISSS